MDFNTYFEEEYRNTLQEIQDYFQETLTSHMEDDTRRFKNRKFTPKTFPDVGFMAGDKHVLFKNLTLPTRPDLHMRIFAVDFKNQCLYTTFKFEDLHVSTDYELSSSRDGDVGSRNGSIKFNFTVSASGQVGIFFTEDSFSPITYDLRYDIGDLQVEISPDEESLESFDLDPKNTQPVERKLMSLFWPELKDYLYYEIYRIISGNVVEFSVSELLIDEPQHLKRYAVERIEHGNFYIDQCLDDLNRILEKQSSFKSTETFFLKLQNGGEFRCKEAKLLQTSLKRSENTSFVNDKDEYYCTHVNVQGFQFGFLNSVIRIENESFEGDVIVKPYRNKILFKVDESNGRKKLFLEIIDILDWEFEVKPKNDGVQKFFEGELKPYIVGYVWYHVNYVLQKYIDEFNAEN